MSDYDYGPPRTWEITWKSGHIERVQGHQVIFDSDRQRASAVMAAFGVAAPAITEPRFTIHGSFDGKWRLVMAASEAELVSIRDVTDHESVPDGLPEVTP